MWLIKQYDKLVHIAALPLLVFAPLLLVPCVSLTQVLDQHIVFRDTAFGKVIGCDVNLDIAIVETIVQAMCI